MKNKMLSIALVFVFVVSLSACSLFRPYDPDDFIGLTSVEIIEKYGEFDNHRARYGVVNSQYLYYSGVCGYMVKEAQVGFFGTDPPKYFCTYFDANGVAYKCAYETGGWGG